MRRISLLLAEFVILFTLVAAPVQSAMAATTVQTQSQSQVEAKTFTGRILFNGDNFVLSDLANKSNYTLDNPQKASPYEGKTVKVTGTFDMASNLIHVETIQEVA